MGEKEDSITHHFLFEARRAIQLFQLPQEHLLCFALSGLRAYLTDNPTNRCSLGTFTCRMREKEIEKKMALHFLLLAAY